MRDRVSGRVREFDQAKGWGEVVADDGQGYFFHCTQISDGTRAIEPDTEVVFDVRPGRRGRWEAVAVSPRPAS